LGSILACGAYVPRLRLARATIQEAMGWLARPNERREAGARAVCNWDEDTLTLAVEAARGCLAAARRAPAAVTLASTTLPFADRSNATLLAAALDLAPEMQTMDVTATLRAATTALAQASRATAGPTLLVASDARSARPGSEEELQFGAAAVALLVAPASSESDGALAHIRAAAHLAADFVDHYRMSGQAFDYSLEERWIRDEGIGKLAPPAIAAALQAAGLKAGDIRHCVLPLRRASAQRLARASGLEDAQLAADLREDCGDTGVAQPLLLLASTLETAGRGEHILLLGLGQGVDALVLTAAGTPLAAGHGPVSSALARRHEETSYTRYLSHRGLLEVDFGMRAERDNRSAQSVMWRKERQVTGFVGGRCTRCGTQQFPRSRVCVNPECRLTDTQSDCRLAELKGRVKSFTEDWQAYAPRPPALYGNVEFEGGGNLLMEFTDADSGEVEVGMPVKFVFRIKDVDRLRAFRRYFWKATGAL
jgi:3-hydroxy-3-methylglutaryl CoA synthase